MRILDGEDLSDIADGDQEPGGLSTAAKRQNYEQALLAKASWAQEAAEWEQQFQLKRNDLDEAQALVDNGNGFVDSWTETHNSQERLRVENQEDGFMR